MFTQVFATWLESLPHFSCKNKYLDEELPNLEREAQFLKNLMENVHSTNITTIANLHKNILEAQKQVGTGQCVKELGWMTGVFDRALDLDVHL